MLGSRQLSYKIAFSHFADLKTGPGNFPYKQEKKKNQYMIIKLYFLSSSAFTISKKSSYHKPSNLHKVSVNLQYSCCICAIFLL